jgi:two-component system LytT family sensor kinase
VTSSSIFTSLSNVRGILALAGVLLWMVFHGWIVHHWFGMDLTLAALDGAVSTIAVLVVTLVLSNSMSYLPRKGRILVVLGLSFFLACSCLWLTNHIMNSLSERDSLFDLFLQRATPVRGAIYFLIIAGVSIASGFNFQLREHEEVSKREAVTNSMIREAELQKLQQQLQPHFLFNCLNSINAMIILKPEEAGKMVQHLSDFLRTTLKRADEHWITLEEEWNYLQLYLDIEKVRFGHRLDVSIDFDEPSRQWTMPTLLLQPLVENAIKYGLYGTTGHVTIGISASVKDQVLQLQITNPFDADARASGGNGFGLSGLTRRLYLLFARNDLLETSTRENKFTVTLKIPLRP